jgi:hypothetical protein
MDFEQYLDLSGDDGIEDFKILPKAIVFSLIMAFGIHTLIQDLIKAC